MKIFPGVYTAGMPVVVGHLHGVITYRLDVCDKHVFFSGLQNCLRRRMPADLCGRGVNPKKFIAQNRFESVAELYRETSLFAVHLEFSRMDVSSHIDAR